MTNRPKLFTIQNRGESPSTKRNILIGALAIMLAVLVTPSAAVAQNIWIGGTGNWSNAANWTGGVPGGTDNVQIDGGDGGTNSVVSQNVTASINGLLIDTGDTLTALDGFDLTIGGTAITNNGTWNLNSTGSLTDVRFADGATLGGTGQMIWSDSANNRIFGASSTNTLTHGADHTIRGAGQLLSNFGNMINNGTIIADQATALVIDPRTSFVNNGTLRATGAGGLQLIGGSFTNNSTIDAFDGSRVDVNSSTVTGGTLTTSGSGFFHLNNATLVDLTNTGQIRQNNSFDSTFQGAITNNGTWNLNSTGSLTDVRFADGATLGGTGQMIWSDSANNQMFGTSSTNTLTHGADHTIRGAGQLLTDFGNMINNGTIIADQATALVIDPRSSFVNNGTLRANAGSTLDINAGGFVNAVGGLMTGDGTIDVTAFSFINDGMIAPGASPGTLTLLGDYGESVTANMLIEIGGTTQGTEYDLFDIFGTASLAGTLQIDMLSFTPSSSDTFTILTTTGGGISGTWSNAVGTVQTIEGHTFDITYNSNSVVLSNFVSAAVPEPSSGLLLAVAMAAFTLRRRRLAIRGSR